MYFKSFTPVVGCALVLASCAQDVTPSPEIGVTEAPLPWSSNDRPEIFTSDLVYMLSDLPEEGTASQIPWAGNYWPTYQDNINYRWEGSSSLAPSTKYGAAFGVEGIEDAVSRYYGVDSQERRAACRTNADCESTVGEACAKRNGRDEGRCIPKWFGICHAWAPAAIMHAEPRQPVTRNGVTFKVNDIKALLSLAHDRGVAVKFASGRCNANDETDGIAYDEWGRPIPGDCIDTNPGTYHLLLANYLGLKGETFVEDRTYDAEVWNQPIAGFKVNNLTEISAQEANQRIGVIEGGTSESHTGELGRREWQHFGPFELSRGQEVQASVSGTGDVDLYLRFGSRPTTRYADCASTSPNSSESCTAMAPSDSQVWVSVYGYNTDNTFNLDLKAGGTAPLEYRFNDRAERFFAVSSTVQYVTESPASRDGFLGNRISNYLRSDRYTYVLELDGDGRIVGGEWTGESKRNHIDFLWLPVELRNHTIAGGKLTLANIMSLYRESIGDTTELTVEQRSGTVARNAWVRFGPFDVADGTDIEVTMTGSDDADLYVRAGAPPGISDYDCRPYSGGSSEACSVAGGGEVFVAVRGYATSSDFTLEIRYQAAE